MHLPEWLTPPASAAIAAPTFLTGHTASIAVRVGLLADAGVSFTNPFTAIVD